MKKQFKPVGLLACLLVVFVFPGHSSAEVAITPEQQTGVGVFVQQFFGGPLEVKFYISVSVSVGDLTGAIFYALYPEPPMTYVFVWSRSIPLFMGVNYPVTELVYWGFGGLLAGFMGTPANLLQGYWLVLL